MLKSKVAAFSNICILGQHAYFYVAKGFTHSKRLII